MKANKTYIIRHKETKEFWRANSGKSSWKEVGHAKNAWAQSSHYNTKDITKIPDRSYYNCWPLFAEQDKYEIVELKHDSEDKLTQAKQFLALCLGRLEDADLHNEITEWLKDNE